MAQKIITALLGFGHAGAVFHAPSLAVCPEFTLAVIVTDDPARVAAARTAYPDARIMSRAHWAARGAAVDLVVVATPPATHAPLVRAALESGHAVVVDKPFTVSSAEGAELIALARARGLLLSTYQNRRWDAEFLTLQGLLAAGALGTVQRFESRLERWQRGSSTKAWKLRATPADGGGVLFDLGTHLIDQALQLFGPATHVYGELATRAPDAPADDDAFVALQHAGGVVSHLWMSHAAAQPGPRLRVLGSAAAYVKVTADVQEGQLLAGMRPDAPGYGVEPRAAWGHVGRAGELTEVPTVPANFTHYYTALAAALRDGTPPPVDPADAVAALRIIEAVRAQRGGLAAEPSA